jgi:hypothetical protein
MRGAAETGRDFVVTSLPLANPGARLCVVDSSFRTVEEFQPATITDSRWSLLYSAANQPIELYDLRTDAVQAINVAGDHPDVVRRLHTQYVELLRQCATASHFLEPRSTL